MKVLIGCEESGVVRDAFAKLGHNAWSCDLKPCRTGGKHLQCDLLTVLANGWDLMVAHPPCTDLAVSGAKHFAKKGEDRINAAIDFSKRLWNTPIPKICLENPVGILSTRWRKWDQMIDPVLFGHADHKATCLWLKNLLPLTIPSFYDLPVLETARGRSFAHTVVRDPTERAKTFVNIAYAMATQWGRRS
jgi:hypothetical protein